MVRVRAPANDASAVDACATGSTTFAFGPGGEALVRARRLENPRQHLVDGSVDRHSAVARVDLDVAGAGIEASPPGDDSVRPREDRNRAHLLRERRSEVLAEHRAA